MVLIARANLVQTEVESLREQVLASERKTSDLILESKQKDHTIEQLKTNQTDLEDRLRRRADECDR